MSSSFSCPGSCQALWHFEWCGAGPGSRGQEGMACFWLLCFQQPLIPVTGFSYGRTCPGTLPCASLLSWPACWLQMGGFAPSLELCFFAIRHSQFGDRDAKAEASCRGWLCCHPGLLSRSWPCSRSYPGSAAGFRVSARRLSYSSSGRMS